jgi:hypothetical protein
MDLTSSSPLGLTSSSSMDLTSSSPLGLTSSSPVLLAAAPMIDKLDIVIAKQDEILAKLNATNMNKKKNNKSVGQSLTSLKATNTTMTASGSPEKGVATKSGKTKGYAGESAYSNGNVAANQSSYYNQQPTNNTYTGNTYTGEKANTETGEESTNTNTNTNNSNLSGGRRRNHRNTRKHPKKHLKKYPNNTKARVVRKSFLKTLVSKKQKKSLLHKVKKTRGRGRA